ncbi:MAG: polyphosphate kinase 2 [Arenimonas sp.]
MSKYKKKDYAEEMQKLQLELARMARWLQHSGKRLLVLVEGRDTAGKGGVIAAMLEGMNPRQCRVVALSKPSEREQTQWYFQRYLTHLPSAGEVVLYDRSWYNRAGVESVMSFATPAQVDSFLKQAPVLEKQLVDDGILLFKYWLAVDQEEQEQRFAERLADPLKRWKLSPIDIAARQKYAAYTTARERMFVATHTPHAPWTVVDFNSQKRGRLTLIRDLLDRLPEQKVPESRLAFPALRGKPGVEHYTGPVKPIKGKF